MEMDLLSFLVGWSIPGVKAGFLVGILHVKGPRADSRTKSAASSEEWSIIFRGQLQAQIRVKMA